MATVERGATSLGTPGDGNPLYILGGGATITGNVDHSALTNGLTYVEISREFYGVLGGAGAPFICEIQNHFFYLASGGEVYYQAKDTTDATPLVWVHSGGHFRAVTDGTVTRFEVSAGTVTISAPFIATTLRVGGGNVSLLDATSTDPTLIHMTKGGGRLRTERGATTITCEGGDIIIDAGSNTIGTLNALGGGIKLLGSGTITTANCYSSIPDLSSLTQPVTITNSTVNMSLPGAQAFLDHALVTFTNTPTRLLGDGRPV